MIPGTQRMMIAIGHRAFLESRYIDEILPAHGSRAERSKHVAAEVGILIDATQGKEVKSIIKLRSEHLVLSSLEPETIQSRLKELNPSSA